MASYFILPSEFSVFAVEEHVNWGRYTEQGCGLGCNIHKGCTLHSVCDIGFALRFLYLLMLLHCLVISG